jgi:hypothetical protein
VVSISHPLLLCHPLLLRHPLPCQTLVSFHPTSNRRRAPSTTLNFERPRQPLRIGSRAPIVAAFEDVDGRPSTNAHGAYRSPSRYLSMKNRQDRRVVPAIMNVLEPTYVIPDSMPPAGEEGDRDEGS